MLNFNNRTKSKKLKQHLKTKLKVVSGVTHTVTHLDERERDDYVCLLGLFMQSIVRQTNIIAKNEIRKKKN